MWRALVETGERACGRATRRAYVYKAGPQVYGGSWGSTDNGALTPLGRMEKPEALPIDRGMRGNYNTHAMYIVQYILPYLHLYGKERLKWHPETNLRGTKW